MRRWVIIAVLGACGGNDDSRLDRATAEEMCRPYCEHQCSCDGGCSSLEPCIDQCLDATHWYYRTSVWVARMECLTDRSCDSTDLCNDCEPTSAHLEFEDACEALLRECGEIDDTIAFWCESTPSSDNGRMCILVPELIEEDMTECLLLPCTDVAECFSGVYVRGGA